MTMPVQKPGQSKQDYETPSNFLTAVRKRLKIQAFTFDFACSMENRKAPFGWTEADDSLGKTTKEWYRAWYLAGESNRWAWLNPPYDDISAWAVKCLALAQAGGRVAFLVPASVGSNWFRDFIHQENGVEVLFLNGRLCFIEDWRTTINPKTGEFYTSEPLYPKDCMLVLFGTRRSYLSNVWTWKTE